MRARFYFLIGLCSILLCVCAYIVPIVHAATSTTNTTEESSTAKKATEAYAQKNYTEASALWRTLAEKGDIQAMYHLGTLLELGQGSEPKPQEALAWFRTAADKGQIDAQYRLGLYYEKGEILPQNDAYAAGWYSLAATGGHSDAQARLGHLYSLGKGVPKNDARAVLLLYGAAMSGHTKARTELFAMAQTRYKGKIPKVVLFGVDLSQDKGVKRADMRKTLAKAGAVPVREDNGFICDVYDVKKLIPGATEMAACYGPKPQQLLGFLKIDYSVKDKKQANSINIMMAERFGKHSAGESDTGTLWNLGNVIVASQYIVDSKQVGLMYMMPKVYHTTQ